MTWLGSNRSATGKWPLLLALALATIGLAAPPAHAQTGALDLADPGDTAWVLGAGILALLSSLPGFSLFAGGRAHGRHHATTIYQGISVALLAALLWALVGYTSAFGAVAGGWLGAGNAWMLTKLGNVRAGTSVPESAFVLFQLSSAMLAPTFLVAAVVGRARTGWLLAFTGFWSLVVYAPVAHWIWGQGWLASSFGTLDWSGGIVLNTTAGISAFILAIIFGRRGPKGPPPPPFAQVIALLGACLFLVGRLATSGAAAMTANDDAAAAILATLLAAAAGAMAWQLFNRLRHCPCGPLPLARGLLSGLAAIAPCAGYVSPGGAILIGLAGAIVCRSASKVLRARAGFDDSSDIFAIFGLGGIVGSLLLAVFLAPSLGGIGFAPGMTMMGQLLAQGTGVAVAAIWAALASLMLATMVSMLVPMRVTEDHAHNGLDTTLDQIK